MSDIELYQGLKKGDRKTIVTIYNKLLPKATVWILKNRGTREDAHDTFQETLETILLKVDKVNSSFEGLVIAMCKHKWIDKLRKASTTTKTKEALIISYKNDNIGTHTEIESSNVAYQKHRLMEKYFSQLSETCQKVMTMMKQGISVQDIVTQLSLSSANTLYRRKAACIERWSSLIKKDSSYKELVS